jgi:transcriptional regulator
MMKVPVEKINAIVDDIKKATDDQQEKVLWDKALDLVETIVEATPTKIDDFVIKPIIKIIRNRFSIPDND